MSDDEMLLEHKRTYNGFVAGSVYSAVGIIIVLALMALFLV